MPEPAGRLSMADVAARLGVSAMTVSRVLNDRPGVSDETRRRVHAAIEELGYQENMAARTLAGGRSRTLGAIAVKTAFYGPSHTLFGIEAAARASGNLLTFVSVQDPTLDELRAAVTHLRIAHVDGMIVNAPMQSVLRHLGQLDPGLPTVITCDDPAVPASVSIDQAIGARAATRHLLELGHHTIHHVRGPAGWIDGRQRAEGWRAELRRHGRPVPPTITGDWTPRSGYAAGRRLADDPSVTAIFVANDEMAGGVVRALIEAGRSVPDDVSVVGFDDAPDGEFRIPPLTTVRQDFDDLGQRSVAALLELINCGNAARSTVAPTLVVRASTAAPIGGRRAG